MSKSIFWTNFAAITLTGLVATSIAFGWTNPGGDPPSGSGGISVDTSGNVGIGTMSPTAKLHLAGKLRVADGTQAAGRVLSSDASGVASWIALGKGSSFDHYDVWGIDDGIKSCTTLFSLMNSKSGLSGSGKTSVGGHARVFMATDGRWMFVVTAEDCSPEDNQPGGYGLIPRTSTGAAIPGYWSYKGSL